MLLAYYEGMYVGMFGVTTLLAVLQFDQNVDVKNFMDFGELLFQKACIAAKIMFYAAYLMQELLQSWAWKYQNLEESSLNLASNHTSSTFAVIYSNEAAVLQENSNIYQLLTETLQFAY